MGNGAKHEDRIAVVSGGASGIGRAIAERLESEGARVAVLDTVGGIACDVSDPDGVAAALASVRRNLGEPDILIHCAAYQTAKPFVELTLEEWQTTFRVNVDGAYLLSREVLPAMRLAGWGRILLVASSSFFAPPPGMAHYISSKGALIGLVRGLAAEVGVDGITVNALAPGLTRTEKAVADVPAEHFASVLARQAIKRNGEVGDQAAAASFLVSDDASFISGQTILVDGGEGHV